METQQDLYDEEVINEYVEFCIQIYRLGLEKKSIKTWIEKYKKNETK